MLWLVLSLKGKSAASHISDWLGVSTAPSVYGNKLNYQHNKLKIQTNHLVCYFNRKYVSSTKYK